MGSEAKLILQKDYKSPLKVWLKLLEWRIYSGWRDVIGYIPVVCIQMQGKEEIK